MVCGLLQFVDHCHSIVLNADVALAVLINDEVILAQTELARALTLLVEGTCGREERPVDVLLLRESVQIEVAQRTYAAHDLLGDVTRAYLGSTNCVG